MNIPVNRKRFPIAMIWGIAFVVLLVFLIIRTPLYFNADEYFQKFNWIMFYIGLLFWALLITSLSAADYLKTVFDKNAQLSISEAGIDDNLSIFSLGSIDWSDITEIEIKNSLRFQYLVIELRDPESLIRKQNIFKRRTLKSFLRRFGSPVVISQKRVNFDLKKLKDEMLKMKNG
jgi:hypothetical protein